MMNLDVHEDGLYLGKIGRGGAGELFTEEMNGYVGCVRGRWFRCLGGMGDAMIYFYFFSSSTTVRHIFVSRKTEYCSEIIHPYR